MRRLVAPPGQFEMRVGPNGPQGQISIPRAGDGVFELVRLGDRYCLTPDETSYYLYFTIPPSVRARTRGPAHVRVEYQGERWGEFRIHYASTDKTAPEAGLYKPAEQRWNDQAAGQRRFRWALFPLPDFDPDRTQNLGASFRIEYRNEMLIYRVVFALGECASSAEYPLTAPLPELRKMPGRFYPINYLFLEITNACNFKCTWCPDAIMTRKRGFMKKEQAFGLLDEIAEKRSWLGPLFPVKLHQMGEPMLHPDLIAIVERAEARGVPIELNTNCGHITEERVDALYRAGLSRLILSYQTPDAETFQTRKALGLSFEAYRDKVRLAVERKVALGARAHIEIDIMNTKRADGYRIVSDEHQATVFLDEWISFCRSLEVKYSLSPRHHDSERIRGGGFLDLDEDSGRYALLDGVDLVFKRCHDWGNTVGGHRRQDVPDTYCPAPYDQLVIQWNGDAVACCTDFEGQTQFENVFQGSIEAAWKSEIMKQRKRDMLEGRLLAVCARCQGLK